MDKKFGYIVLLGLLIGAVFGMGIGSANGNPVLGIGIGALAGVLSGMVYCSGCSSRREE